MHVISKREGEGMSEAVEKIPREKVVAAVKLRWAWFEAEVEPGQPKRLIRPTKVGNVSRPPEDRWFDFEAVDAEGTIYTFVVWIAGKGLLGTPGYKAPYSEVYVTPPSRPARSTVKTTAL